MKRRASICREKRATIMHREENVGRGGAGDGLLRPVLSDHAAAAWRPPAASIVNGGNRVITPHLAARGPAGRDGNAAEQSIRMRRPGNGFCSEENFSETMRYLLEQVVDGGGPDHRAYIWKATGSAGRRRPPETLPRSANQYISSFIWALHRRRIRSVLALMRHRRAAGGVLRRNHCRAGSGGGVRE